MIDTNLYQHFDELQERMIKIKNKKLNEIIQNYIFFHVFEKINLDQYPKILSNIRESKTIIINQNNKLNQKASANYFFIGFQKTVLLIQQSSLHLLDPLFSNACDLNIIFLSDTKELFNLNSHIRYNETQIYSSFYNDIEIFNKQLKIITNKKSFTKKIWKYIKPCISGYLLYQAYSKSNKNRLDILFKNTNNQREESLKEIDKESYFLIHQIGTGSTFSANLIYHIENEELMVLKMPKKNDVETSKLIEREKENYLKINNFPLVPKLHGIVKDKYDSLVIEYIRGNSLMDIVSKEVILSGIEKKTIIFEIMIIIEFLHRNNFIIRDLKPDNIIIDENETAVLIDFDRIISNNRDNENFTNDFSHDFVAPEVNEGEITNKCDIYSLGMLIYYLVINKMPTIENRIKYNDFILEINLEEIYNSCIKEEASDRPNISQVILDFYINNYSQIKIDNLNQNFKQYFKDIYEKSTFQTIDNFINLRNVTDTLYNIGKMYVKGKCVIKNIVRALFFFAWSAPSCFSKQFKSKQINKIFYSLGFFYDQEITQKNKIIVNYIEKVIYYYTLASDYGDIKSQNRLGNIYLDGDYVSVDIKKSIHYFTLAAEKGCVNSQLSLGQLYFEGEHVLRDIDKAIHFFTMAANNKDVISMNNLGIIYLTGEYVRPDIDKGLYYIRMAANLNYEKSLFFLGDIYYKGKYVNRDIKKAINYFLLASRHNYSDAYLSLGNIYSDGKYISINISKAIKYYKMASDLNNIGAQFNLGLLYGEGKYVQADVKKAIYYFTLAANQNDIDSQIILGLIYSNGIYIPIDIYKAKYYFTLAANQNSPLAQFYLGNLYYNNSDIKKAIHYSTLAADQNNAEAQLLLAIIYGSNKFIQLDFNKAMHYLQLSADRNNSAAQYALGKLYIGRDNNKAIYYLTLSAKKNYGEAQFFLYKYLYKEHPSKAIYWLKESAKNRNMPSFFTLGFMYENGINMKRDVTQAIHYYKEASSLNDYQAKNNLGIIYRSGNDVEKNIGLAIEYFKEAIRQKNDFTSKLNLAITYIYDLNDIDSSFELLFDLYRNNFKYSYDLLYLVLYKKYQSDFFQMKKEIDKYTTDSNQLIYTMQIIIIQRNWYNQFSFDVDFEKYRYYLFQHSPCEVRVEKSEQEKSPKNITSIFYEGFGHDLLAEIQ
ncbi:hypothetical protein M9Y10_003387 [Tritrichomonas musculus]|uniref:Protein kinase domain-containing protein n=1 Tax=Tritrichomonas musculus TaxID=1915356 RepID=A0ABR2JQL9_9EUKA